MMTNMEIFEKIGKYYTFILENMYKYIIYN